MGLLVKLGKFWLWLKERVGEVLVMAQREGSALLNTIFNQSVTIERLYTELEEERKASETATTEALSMIFRLQEEKATVIMEARHYQRLAEEKLHHAEESLAILEEAMSHREIELSSLMSEREGSALLNTIFNQSVTIERLYTELEEERKASETGTTEALSMISRLQEEKATVIMEARQYQRLAEVKLHHAEESLAILEEAMSHREIELSSLMYQIQDYKHRLLRAAVEEMETIDYPIFNRFTDFLGKNSLQGDLRKNLSMPAASLDKLCPEMNVIDDDSYSLPCGKPVSRINKRMDTLTEEHQERRRQKLHAEHLIERLNSHGEEAEKLDLFQTGKVTEKMRSESISATNRTHKVLAKDCCNLGEHCKYCSEYSKVNHCAYCDSTTSGRGAKLDGKGVAYMDFPLDNSENMSECIPLEISQTEVNGNTTHSASVQDIQLPDSQSFTSESCNQELQEPLLKTKEIIEMPDSLSQAVTSNTEEASVSCSLFAADPEVAIAPSQTEAEQPKTWIKQLENDIKVMKQEYSNVGKGQLELLRGIHWFCSSLVLLREANLIYPFL